MEERRSPSRLDVEKFSTQRQVTFILLLVFAAVVLRVMAGDDQSERSMILQTVINLTLLAVGYWLGASTPSASTVVTPGLTADGVVPAAAVEDVQAKATKAQAAPVAKGEK